MCQEFIALDLLAIGQAQHLAFHLGHAAVQRFQLINQFFDAVIVQLHLFNQRDQFTAQLFVILLPARRQFLARGKGFHALGTELRQLGVNRFNLLEIREHFRL